MAPSRKACPGKLGLLRFCAGCLLSTLLSTQLASLAMGQKVVSARAGLITYLQGPAFVDGKRVILKSVRFPQMKDGQTLSTARGRAELLLAPGAVLRLAENSQVRMEDTQLADTRLALQRGDALIEVLQLPEGNRIQIELAETVTELTRPGLYRFGKAQNETHDSTTPNTLRVYGGEALVRSGTNMAVVKRGMAVDLPTGPEPNVSPGLTVRKFDRKPTDSLHAWAARRSFDLFISDPAAREKQNNWQFAGGGYLENKNFGVEFRAFIRRAPPPGRPPVPPAEIGSKATPAP
jgi:hypothetical protein